MGLRRRLTILGVILLLGAGVSVAVAWSCAIWHYVGRAPRIAIGSTLEDSTTPWQAAMYHSSLAHRVHSAWGPLVTTQQAGDWPSELMGRSARLLLPQSDEARIAGARVLDRRGWPMRSMWSALELEALAPLRPGSAPTQSIGDVSRVIRGIELSPYPQFGSEAQLHRHRVLPLGIIWRGFAVNTLLFAAMAWFLLVILQYSRRAMLGGQAFQMPFNATTQLSLDSGSAGVVRQRSFIHFDFSGRGLFGSILQREGRAAEVEPGTHIFETSWHVVISEGSFVGGTGGYTTTTELYRDKVAIQATVTVLPEGSETVELVADESLRPGVEASLTLMRITAQPGPVRTVLGDGTVFIKASVMTTDVQGGFHVEEPPTDLAFDVFLRAGGREWLVGQIDSDIAGPRDFPWFRGTADGLEDTHVDVILRPSLAAARRTVSITRIWDGEIVLEGVPVQWKD